MHGSRDPNPGDHADKIIKWYKGHIPDTEHEGELEVKSVSHICGNLFKITYTGHGRWVDDPNSIALENFLNPDDDGNEPITIRGKKYLISGYLDI